MLQLVTSCFVAADLFVGAKPGDIAIFAGVVALIVIASVVSVSVGLIQQRRTKALVDTSGQLGPEPPADSRIRRHRAANGATPPEIAALGQPRHVHAPQSIGQELTNLVASLFGQPPAPPPSDKPTYLAFDNVLVAVLEGVYTVIPWDEITEFRHPLGFGISTGQKFAVGPDHKDYGVLYGKLQSTIDEVALPRAVAAIQAGKEVTFQPFRPLSNFDVIVAWLSNPLNPELLGPLTLTAESISYQGRSLAWRDIGSLELIHYQKGGLALYTALVVGRRGGLLSFWRFNLKSIPNETVLLGLLRRLVPKDVLVATDSPRKSSSIWR